MKTLAIQKANDYNSFLLNEINLFEPNKHLSWQLSNLLPKGKKEKDVTKEYLFKRASLKLKNDLDKINSKFEAIENVPDFISLKISIDWKRSQTWGLNPTATLQVWTKDGYSSYTAKASGCGYCKESAVIASVLNQCLSLRKLIINNSNIQSYGISGDHFSTGGVGVSSLQDAFSVLGYELKSVASGKLYNVYSINL